MPSPASLREQCPHPCHRAGPYVPRPAPRYSLPSSGPSAAGQQRALRELSAMSSPEPHRGLIRIRPLPTRVELTALGSVKQGMTVLGVGGDESRPVAIDLFTGDGRLIIAGPRRSGRST